MKKIITIQKIIHLLEVFWKKQGCTIIQPIDIEVGAATFHPSTFLNSIGPEPWKLAYVQPSRRPADSKNSKQTNKNQKFLQYQVIIKPSPKNLKELYLKSLSFLGIKKDENDIKFIEDNWESPTLGAWGIGWEIWLNGIEITQFTYFQQTGGLNCIPITGELAYGIERIGMHLQNVKNIKNLIWSINKKKIIKHNDIFSNDESEISFYNLKKSNTKNLLKQFNLLKIECENTINENLIFPSYELLIKLSHIFNLLDAKSIISIIEKQRYISEIRNLANIIAKKYYKKRKNLNFPMLK